MTGPAPRCAKGAPYVLSLKEASGALGDLGTLLPLMLGAIAVAGLAPMPVLAGFGLFYIATALVYRLPVPVQPMKAVAAVLLTAGLSQSELAVTGVTAGAVLLVLGLTGWITKLARLVPQSVLAGLQLGLGIALALVALKLLGSAPVFGAVLIALIAGMSFVPGCPAALVAVVVAVVAAPIAGVSGFAVTGVYTGGFAVPALPKLAQMQHALTVAVLPQLSLTLMHAVVLTSLVAGDYFGARASHVTPARLSLTSGLANLLLVPFGAMPMCHGAGGLAAHVRFGARSGTAPLLLGIVLLGLALLPGTLSLDVLGAVPLAALGALLMLAAGELAFSKRLIDSRRSCWPVIAVTAAGTVFLDPFWGLLAGSFAELVRVGLIALARNRHTT